MSTDQLLDDPDMDRALRDLLPPMPRSGAWEARQRDALLAFIETGDIRAERAVPSPVDAAVLPLDTTSTGDPGRRVAVVLAIAAATVLLIAGLVIAPRWSGQEIPPATVPAPGPVTTAPAPSDELGFPDVFPIVPDDHPLAAQATAMYGGMTGWSDAASAQAVVAIDDGTRLSGAVQLLAFSAVTPGMWGSLDAERVTVAGVVGTLYTERGTPEIKTFVVDGEPVVAVQALDPVAFVEAAGGVPVHAKVGAAGNLVFDVRTLPDGYRVVVEPGEWHQGGAVQAYTRVPDRDNGDGMTVFVQRSNPLLGWSIVGDLERIDVNGRLGWKQDRGPGSTVIWQVSDGTWAMIGGAMTVDAAVELALAVEFVDRATWEQRYDVELGNYPTREEMEIGASAITAPPLVALEEIGGLPTDVPISCGSTPPRDELVDVPAVAATPQDALAAFIETVEPGLSPNGWIHTWNGEDSAPLDAPQHRFDYRRDDGQLVTAVYVDAVDGGWAATRWLSTPC